ncbi:hypothetical protein HDV62DRAFT_62906 [Trichoderma sp. SZMC 28011]
MRLTPQLACISSVVVESECARHARRRSETGSRRTGCLGWFRCSLAFAFGGWQRSCSRREGGAGGWKASLRGRKMSPETLQWVQPFFFFLSSHVDASRLSTRNYRALSLAVRLCTSSRYAAGMLAADWRLSAVFSRYRRLADWFDWPLSISRRPLSRRFFQRKRWALCYQGAFEDAQRESREVKGQTSGSGLVWGGCCY